MKNSENESAPTILCFPVLILLALLLEASEGKVPDNFNSSNMQDPELLAYDRVELFKQTYRIYLEFSHSDIRNIALVIRHEDRHLLRLSFDGKEPTFDKEKASEFALSFLRYDVCPTNDKTKELIQYINEAINNIGELTFDKSENVTVKNSLTKELFDNVLLADLERVITEEEIAVEVEEIAIKFIASMKKYFNNTTSKRPC